MVAGLQNDASHTKLKLLELERSVNTHCIESHRMVAANALRIEQCSARCFEPATNFGPISPSLDGLQHGSARNILLLIINSSFDMSHALVILAASNKLGAIQIIVAHID